MSQERVTVSLDDDAEAALDDLVDRLDAGQSEVVRRALTFYAANFEAAMSTRSGENLADYHRMLAGGEHVLLDVDFLHCFLDRVDTDSPDEEFLEAVDRVSEYHAHEYAERFDDVSEVLDWLSLCGFLTVRDADAGTYHVVFPSESMRWFMTRFLRQSVAEAAFDVDVEEGVSKVLVRQRN
jgi:predicted transcriptional regulator